MKFPGLLTTYSPRATRSFSAEVKLNAIKTVKVSRELLCRELPKSCSARNYVFRYRETVSIFGVTRTDLVFAKFQSRMDPERILAAVGKRRETNQTGQRRSRRLIQWVPSLYSFLTSFLRGY